MTAKGIRDLIKTAERRARNVYLRAKDLRGADRPPVRVINAREHKGFTQALTISGRWVDVALHTVIYEQ